MSDVDTWDWPYEPRIMLDTIMAETIQCFRQDHALPYCADQVRRGRRNVRYLVDQINATQ